MRTILTHILIISRRLNSHSKPKCTFSYSLKFGNGRKKTGVNETDVKSRHEHAYYKNFLKTLKIRKK